MTWWSYVQRHAGGQANARIADAVGITPSSVGRWSKGSLPDPAQAAAFARAYGRPVLEAFVSADFLTPVEAGERPAAAPSLNGLTDEQLINEISRRLRVAQPPIADGVTHPRFQAQVGETIELDELEGAARHGHVVTNPELAGQESAGEGNQDDDIWEPA